MPQLEHLAAVMNPSARGQAGANIAALQGRGSRRALAEQLAALPMRSRLVASSGNAFEDYQVAVVILLLDEPELALDYVERISRDIGNEIDWAIMHPALDAIRCQPRFRAMVANNLRTRDPHVDRACGKTP